MSGMAALTVTTSDQLVYRSQQGSATNNDSVAIRLAPAETGTVYLERSSKGTPADDSTSFFISGAEVYSATLVAGEEIHAVTDSGTVDIRVDANDSGEFGS